MNPKTTPSIQGALTCFAPGSVRESWHIVFPLMLTTASAGIMIFVDRLILAQYSTQAMTAAASAGLVVATFQFSFVALAMISEVFVGQYNGAGDYKKVGSAVWQMIWFSFLSNLVFIPLALYTGEFFVADPYDGLGEPYFRWLMLFGSVGVLQASLAGFFVGLGRPKIVTGVTIFGNVLNLVLDILLVFGIEGWIPPLGTMGAAIATNISFVIQAAILAFLFFGRKNREKYNTQDGHFDFPLFKKSIQIGLPTAVSHFIELGAWSVQLNMMARVSEIHITVMAIGQSALLLFMFISDGLSKGMSSIASNYMGANRYDIVPKTFRSMVKIQICLMAVASLFFLVFPSLIIDGFIEGDFSPQTLSQLEYYSRWALVWVWLFMLVDGISWIISGLLTASGDTKFIMIVNGFSAWVVGLLPLYILVVQFDASPSTAWFLVVCYGVFNFGCFLWRYKTESWKENKIKGP